MKPKMPTIQAIKEVIDEDPRTKEDFYDWMLIEKVLKKQGYYVYIPFDRDMPHHETITREKRKILNTPEEKGKPRSDFIPEKNAVYELKDGRIIRG